MYIGQDETTSPKGSGKGDTLRPIGEAAGAFFTALGYGKKPEGGPAPFNWTPVIVIGGVAVGGLILFGAMGRRPRRRR